MSEQRGTWDEVLSKYQRHEPEGYVQVERRLRNIACGISSFIKHLTAAAEGLDGAYFSIGYDEDDDIEEWIVCGSRPRTPADETEQERRARATEERERAMLAELTQKYGEAPS